MNGSIFFPRWSSDGKQVVFSFEDTGHPPSIQISKTDFIDRRQVTLAQSFTTAQLIRYQSADGLEVPSFVYISAKPVRRKRPAIVWLHGGLGGMSGNRFDAPIQYFIDQGFVGLAPNYRSRGGFGKRLAQFGIAPRRSLTMLPLGATYLRGLSLVDGSRVGVIGFSFGGLLTLMTIAQRPELFAVASRRWSYSFVTKRKPSVYSRELSLNAGVYYIFYYSNFSIVSRYL